jgi:ankyrin repeat protein
MSISSVPTTRHQDYNQLSVLIEQKEQVDCTNRSRIAAIDDVMRTEAFNVDLYELKLEILKDCMQQSPQQRTFPSADWIQAKLKGIKESQLISLDAVMEAREAYMEGKRIIPLTLESKEQLRRAYNSKLDQSLEQFQNDFRIALQTDLHILQQQLTIDKEALLRAYEQLLDSKAPMITELENIAQQMTNLKDQQRELVTSSQMDVWTASMQGNLDYLIDKHRTRSLLQRIKAEEVINIPDQQGNYPLHIAVIHNQLAVAKWLLKNCTQSNACNANGYQALHLAAKFAIDHLIAQELLKAGAFVNAPGEYGRTPLHIAAYHGKESIVQLLLSRDADVNLQAAKDQLKTPLHEAVMQSKLDVVTTLIKSRSLNVNIRDSINHTPLYYAVEAGALTIAALVMGHCSWVSPLDRKDPNHIDQLLQLTPRANAQPIKQLLESFR